MVSGRVVASCVAVLIFSCGGRARDERTNSRDGESGGGSGGSVTGGTATGGGGAATGGAATGGASGSGGDSTTGGETGAGTGGESGFGGFPAGSSGAGTGGAGAGFGGAGFGGAGAGSGGAGAGSGGAGTGGVEAFPPACIRDLLAACPFEGSCTREAGMTAEESRVCFENGVTIEFETTRMGACRPSDVSTERAFTPLGQLCYTRVTTYGPACESTTTVWKDAGGNDVATESRPFPGTQVNIDCEDGGRSSCVMQPCLAAPIPSCSEGTCP